MEGTTRATEKKETPKHGQNGRSRSNKSQPDVVHSEFEELGEAIVEDPIFRVLYDWRKPLLVVAVLILGGIYIRNQIQSAFVQGQQRAATLYSELLKEYETLEEFKEEKEKIASEVESLKASEDPANEQESGKLKLAELTEREARLSESVQKQIGLLNAKIQALQDERQPYSAMGAGFRAMLEAEAGSQDEVAFTLKESKWQAVPVEDSARAFLEASALQIARTALDEEETRQPAFEALRLLARDGIYAHVGAALALARLSNTEEERETALELLRKIALRDPLQNELIEDELQRLEGLEEKGE